MAIPERDTVYTSDGTRKDVYNSPTGSSTGWVIGGIVVVALVIIAYFVFAGHPATNGTNVPAANAPITDTTTPGTSTTPMAPAPSPDTTAPATPAPSMAPAPATPAPAPATPAAPAQ